MIEVDGKLYAVPESGRLRFAVFEPLELFIADDTLAPSVPAVKDLWIQAKWIDNEKYRIRKDHTGEWKVWMLRGEEWIAQ